MSTTGAGPNCTPQNRAGEGGVGAAIIIEGKDMLNVTKLIVAFVTMLGLLSSATSRAQDTGDVMEGKKIATTWCSNCHRIDAGGAGQVGDAAPAWAQVAAMPSTTSMSLHAFLMSPHGRMPDFTLTRAQIDDVVAYILSLRK
jgi:mono/diheme cytochrome c family protein